MVHRPGRISPLIKTALPAIRLGLGPFLLFQGSRVRRHILRMPEAAGPRQGIAGQGPPCRLLIMGDSSAAGVGVTDQADALSGHILAGLAPHWRVTWHLLAKTGWTTADALQALQALSVHEDTPFDIAFVSLGVNDATTEVPSAHWLQTYAALIDRLHRVHGVRRIYAAGLPPMQHFTAMPHPLRWYMGRVAAARDAALGRFVAAHRGGPSVTHAPLTFPMHHGEIATDGFHPGPRIYARWGAHMAALLLKDGPPVETAGAPDQARAAAG